MPPSDHDVLLLQRLLDAGDKTMIDRGHVDLLGTGRDVGPLRLLGNTLEDFAIQFGPHTRAPGKLLIDVELWCMGLLWRLRVTIDD